MVKNKDITKRLIYLAEEFKIFSPDELEGFVEEADDDIDVEFIRGRVSNEVLAINKSVLVNKDKGRYKQTIHVADFVFADMVESDPTENHEFLQWMLTVFRNIIKDNFIISYNWLYFIKMD